jgi:hypothetical protein
MDHISRRYKDLSNSVFPQLSEFLPSILGSFLQPTWYGVGAQKASRISVLPNVGAVATVVVPQCWLCDESGNSYIVCRDFSGKWTIVNTEWIKDVKADSGGDNSPCGLTRFINKVNASITRHTSFVLFDNDNGYIVEHDFINDKLFIYVYNQCQDILEPVTCISSLPPGAVNIHSIKAGTMVISTGSVFHLYDLTDSINEDDEARWKQLNPPNHPSSPIGNQSVKLPVSTQQIVDCDRGSYVYLSSGSVWLVSKSNVCPIVLFDREATGIHYVSICSGADSILLFGYSDDISAPFLTLVDMKSIATRPHSAISNTQIQLNLPLSIV